MYIYLEKILFMNVSVKDKLYKEIKAYCDLNELQIGDYINGLIQKAFMIEKYGERPVVMEKPVKEPEKKEEGEKEVVENSPQVQDVVIDFSKQEELKPVVPMSHDIDEETLKKLTEDNIKPKKRKLK